LGSLNARPALILDTCALFWWHMGMTQLSTAARHAIGDDKTEKFVSAATAWELVTKWRTGREPGFAAVAADVGSVVRLHGFRELAISLDHAAQAAALPLHHRDPFDRIIIAQSIMEGMAIATSDEVFAAYGVSLVW
jgi:PIN domain nuclease of toxin-antitoxin system